MPVGLIAPCRPAKPGLMLITVVALISGCGGGGDSPEPAPSQYTIGGSVSGLTGSGLVLVMDGGREVQVAAGSTSFTFPGSVSDGAPYSVTLRSQPSNPTQACTLTGTSGTAHSNITSVAVSCTTSRFVVGGTITGLTGTGFTLLLNGGTPITVASGAGGFAFPSIASGTNYAVTVGTQPAASGSQGAPQDCTIANGTGIVGGANVANIAVTCVVVSYAVGGTVAGLNGSGLVLQNNGGNDLSVTAGSTSFSFSGKVNAGTAYAVTVKTQPSNPSQTCTVANATGTATANVLVAVNCVSNALTIGGTITGLTGGGLMLLLNGASPLSVAAGATTFVFPSTVAPGLSYTVAVTSHPTGPGQTCTIANASGTVGAGNVANVTVTCTTNPANSWTVGGTIGGLASTGLVLLNGSTSLPVASGATAFAFPASASGTNFSVTIAAQPGNLTCTVSNGAGTVGTANVSSVTVNCGPSSYAVSGTVTGYVGSGLRVLINGGTPRTVAAGATSFSFPPLPGGTAYTVTVGTQPTSPSQLCTVTNGTGTLGNADVSNVLVSCIIVYTISGSTSNQNSNGLVLLLNGGSALSRNIDQATFSFAGLASGTPYSVTVGTQPSAPAQTCSVTNGEGTIGAANVTNVTVLCINNGPIVSGTIQGYTGTGLTLRVNGGAPLSPQTTTRFVFPDLYPPGTLFSASIASQPSAQTCTLIRGMGAINQPMPGVGNNVLNIAVQCGPKTTSALSGTYSALIGGKQNYLTLWPDGTYTYASRLDDPSCGGSSGNGVEYGAYSWNATTGAFAFLTGPVDSNGGCGVFNSSSTPQAGLSGTLVKTGNTLTLTVPSGVMIFTAVTSTPSTMIGSFQDASEQNGGFILLQSDNTYLVVHTQVNGAGNTGVLVGYERGCYTSTTATITFSLSSSCRPDGFPTLDNNGTGGLSDGSLNVPIPFVITGPNTFTFGGDTFLIRLLHN